MYQSDPKVIESHVRQRIDTLHREAKLSLLRQQARPTHATPHALRQKIGWTLIRWGTSLAGAKA